MKNIKYNITMNTPVGCRYGTMNLFLENNCIKGQLNLLEHSEAFYGSMDSSGNCIICGKMITLTRTIEYTAVGKITEKTIALSFREEKNVFKITGTAVAESEVET